MCDTEECTADAVTVLKFRATPGHVHVCAPHERVDREWCDVIGGAPMPCPAGCDSTSAPIFTGTPPLLV